MTQHGRSRALRNGILAATAASALLLAGCAGGGSSDPSSGGSQEFSFTFATSNDMKSPYQVLADAYVKANPDVTITTNPTPNDKYGETIRTQLQAGNASDVIQTTPGSGDARAILPLSEAGFLEPLGETAAGLIPQGSESLYGADGKVYGQPIDFTVASLVASRGTAAMNGITEFPATEDEMWSACSTLADADKSFIALAGAAGPNTGFAAMAISATRVYAEDPDWNQKRIDGSTTFADSQGWKDTLQTIIDMKDKGCFQPGVEGGGFDAITNGLSQGNSVAAFAPSGAAIEISNAAPPEADFAVEPFPAPSGGEPYILASSNYTISINAAAKNKDAASAFVEWLASDEAQQIYYEASGELPISSYSTMDLSGTIYEPVVDLLSSDSYAPLPSAIWPNPSVYEALQVGVQGLLTGQKTVDQVLADMDTAWGQ